MTRTNTPISSLPRALTVLWFALFFSASAMALELPVLVGDGMVLQRDEPIPVWGWAAPGSIIQVQFDRQRYEAETDDRGEWRLTMPALPAGGPFTLAVEGEGETYRFDDIWIGDVWVCSGQSNMEWPLISTQNAENEIASVNDPLIRHFKVPKSWAGSPQDRLQGGSWEMNSAENAGDFTAVGYYFAKRLRSEVDVPIGLINTTWGGSNIESWMDAPSQGLDPMETEKALEEMEAAEASEALKLQKRLAQWPGALEGGFEQAEADWSAADLDVSDWVEIEVPSLWEDSGFNGLDGVAWFRKTFSLTKEQAMNDLEIGLARIDDHDLTFINGHPVGETRLYNEVRRYTVDRRFLREGENVIAVRVLDTGGGGGIWSEPDLLFVRGPGLDISLAGNWLFRVDKGIIQLSWNRNQTPTALYNKMLHPLFHVPVKGVIWYQGEANAFAPDPEPWAYRDQFIALIKDWRSKWGEDDLPFYWVQLANFNTGDDTPTDSPWATLRESQTEALSLPHTGQAVIIDVGDPDDIHPRDKLSVGNRLALHALKNDYGMEQLVTDGPYALSASVSGNTVVVKFDTRSELRVSNGELLRGFELADRDGNWYPAAGVLSGNRVELTSDRVDQPVAVRYAWSDNPETANLTDESGLPANPFRLNEW